MNIFAISGITSAMVCLALLIAALLHDYKSRINQHLALFMFSVMWWGFSIYKITTIPNGDVSDGLFWWRIAHIGVILIPISFFQFVYTFSGIKRPWLIRGAWIIAVFFWITDATPYFIEHVSYIFNGFYYDSPPGVLYILFFIYYVMIVVYSFWMLFWIYRKGDGDRRIQALVILIGIVIAYTAGSTAFFPVFGIDIINPGFGTFLIPVAPMTFFYAITRYRFLKARLIATEILTMITWVILALRIFLIPSSQEREADIIILLAIVLMGIFGIRSAIQESTQRDQLADLSEHLQQKVDEQTKEIRQAYEVERKARIELEQLDKDKDQFILATQHHLRTPLTIVKGYVESLLKMPNEELALQAKPILERTEVATDRLSSLVNDLLDISQMQVGGDVLKKEAVELKPMLESILTDTKGEADKKRITESLDIEEVKMNLDQVKMREALANLLDNAVKYCNDGGIVVVKGEKNGGNYRITFQDTGIGITAEELPRIFNQYFERGEEAEKMNKTGKGIGLVVTKKIIEAHGGRIYAESEGRGKGSKFTVELPLTY